MEELKFFVSRGYELDAEILYEAVRYDDLEMVKWLHSQGCPWDEWIRDSFALLSDGQAEIVHWVIDNYHISLVGCEASYYANFGIAWALERGAVIGDEKDFCAAVANGSDFKHLKWAHKQNFEWDSRVLRGLAQSGRLSQLLWALDIYPVEDLDEICALAVCSRDLRKWEWVYETLGKKELFLKQQPTRLARSWESISKLLWLNERGILCKEEALHSVSFDPRINNLLGTCQKAKTLGNNSERT